MRNRLLIAAMLASAVSFANAASATLCTGTAGNSATTTAATDGSTYIKDAFVIKCSNNTQVAYDQSAVAIAVAANSKKGKTNYCGGSELGGIRKAGDCTIASDLCTAKAADVTSTTGC